MLKRMYVRFLLWALEPVLKNGCAGGYAIRTEVSQGGKRYAAGLAAPSEAKPFTTGKDGRIFINEALVKNASIESASTFFLADKFRLGLS